MKTNKRANNFESLPGAKILPGGCSCCCCCCCLHGIGIGSAGATWGARLGKSGWTKFFIGLAMFLLFGAIGLALDAGVLIGAFEFLDRTKLDVVLPIGVYIVSALFFTYLAFVLVFRFTKNTQSPYSGASGEMDLSERKKAYHKSRFIFQVKLLLISLGIGVFSAVFFSPLMMVFDGFSFLPTEESYLVASMGMSILQVVVLFFIARMLDSALKESMVAIYFGLIYALIPLALLGGASFLMGGLFGLSTGVFGIIVALLSYPFKAFIFEYLRFQYIKAHPKIFRK